MPVSTPVVEIPSEDKPIPSSSGDSNFLRSLPLFSTCLSMYQRTSMSFISLFLNYGWVATLYSIIFCPKSIIFSCFV